MARSELDPWRVIRSFLLLLGWDGPSTIDRAGLAVDWTLTDKQDVSNNTRWAAYRPRIDAAYDALASDNDRLRVAFIVARELAQRSMADDLNNALRAISWEVRGDTLVPAGASVRELFFPEQSQHDAYVEIRGILRKANNSVTIVDPYVDQSILTLLSACTEQPITIRVLTARPPADFSLEAKKWVSQHPGGTLSVRTTKEFHDRFIVLDGRECWHIGCSIKDAGNKAFMLSQVEDEENRTALVSRIEAAWGGAAILV